ncbi:hypothetical protein, partial [Shewanella surugensis]
FRGAGRPIGNDRIFSTRYEDNNFARGGRVIQEGIAVDPLLAQCGWESTTLACGKQPNNHK